MNRWSFKNPPRVLLGSEGKIAHHLAPQVAGGGNDVPELRHGARRAGTAVSQGVAVGAHWHEVGYGIQLVAAPKQFRRHHVVYVNGTGAGIAIKGLEG